jgi:hypothetical protein
MVDAYPEGGARNHRGRRLVRKVLLRLSGSLVAVVGLWMLAWLPLVLTESSAAEPQEQILGDPRAPVTIIEYASLTCPHCAHSTPRFCPS